MNFEKSKLESLRWLLRFFKFHNRRLTLFAFCILLNNIYWDLQCFFLNWLLLLIKPPFLSSLRQEFMGSHLLFLSWFHVFHLAFSDNFSTFCCLTVLNFICLLILCLTLTGCSWSANVEFFVHHFVKL